MKQYEFAEYKRNGWERLNEKYPELKQMPVNNHGYDWVIYNEKGTPVKVEEKSVSYTHLTLPTICSV